MLIQGKAKWPKITGEPVWGYENKFKEWSLDVYVDEHTAHKLEVEGLKDKIKDKGNGQYITFKRKELGIDRKTGEPKQNDPIRIVDSSGRVLQNGQPDNKDYVKYTGPKIGNDTVVNVNFAVNEFKPNQRNANILSLQIWDLVPYEGGEFPVKTEMENTSKVEDWSSEVAE